jgi:hypothetical protein
VNIKDLKYSNITQKTANIIEKSLDPLQNLAKQVENAIKNARIKGSPNNAIGINHQKSSA